MTSPSISSSIASKVSNRRATSASTVSSPTPCLGSIERLFGRYRSGVTAGRYHTMFVLWWMVLLLLLGSVACSKETAYNRLCDVAASMTDEMVNGEMDPDVLRTIAERGNLQDLIVDEEIDAEFAGPALGLQLSLAEEQQGEDEWAGHFLDSIVLLSRECEELGA